MERKFSASFVPVSALGFFQIFASDVSCRLVTSSTISERIVGSSLETFRHSIGGGVILNEHSIHFTWLACLVGPLMD